MGALARAVQLAFADTDRFEIRRRIGEGGMGVVYEAHDRSLNRLVALKTLARVDAASIYRMKREFRSLTGVEHPNLVRLHELFSDGGRWFFTMDLVAGEDFIGHVRGAVKVAQDTVTLTGAFDWTMEEPPPSSAGFAPAGTFDEERLRAALASLAGGVRALHEAGSLHRDLKPSNVLVDEAGKLTVLDFGLARFKSAGQGEASMESMIVGTPAYMAPEQASCDAPSEATDWYAVGVMLYEAMTGVLPFGGNLVQLLTSKQIAEPPRPEELVADLPNDLCELCARLLRREPEERPSGDEVLRALHGAGNTRRMHRSITPVVASLPAAGLVGREEALAKLDQAFDDARDSGPVLVTVSGAPGIGKSALLGYHARLLRERAVVLAGRCYERESVPYKAFDSLIDALTRYLRHAADGVAADGAAAALDPAQADALLRLFPVLARVKTLAKRRLEAAAVPDRIALRQLAFGALRALLAGIAERRPLVLLIDDLHFGDADSASLMAELLRPPDAPPMLVVVSYRREQAADSPLLERMLAPAWSQLAATDQRAVELAELSHAQSQALAMALIDAPAADRARRAAALAEQAGGNPALVVELARHARDGVPTARLQLDDLLAQRIEVLGLQALALLQLVAVASSPLTVDVLAHALGGEGLNETLTELSHAQLLRSGWARRGAGVDVYHPRLKRVLLRRSDAKALQAAHRRLARALAEHGDAPEQVAHHLEQGGERAKATEHLAQAARRAEGALAFDRAAELYRGALRDAGSEQAATTTRLSRALADALAGAGRSAEAAHAYLEAAKRCAATPGHERDALDMDRRAAEHMLRSGHTERGLELMEHVLQGVGLRFQKSPRAALMAIVMHRTRLKMGGLEPAAPQAVSDEERQRMDTCWSMGVGLSMVDSVRASEFHARHLLMALRAGDRVRLARALALEAGHLGSLGGADLEQARELLERAQRMAEESDDAHALGLCKLIRGAQALFTADWRQAVRQTDETVELLASRCANVAWEIATARRFNLVALYYMGEMAELSRRVSRYYSEARERGDRFAESCVRSGSSVTAWLAADQPDVARAHLEEELERWQGGSYPLQRYLAVQGLTYIDLYEGEPVRGLERLEAEWPGMKRSMLLRVQLLRTTMWSLQARCLVAGGEEKMLKRAARVAEKLETEGMASGAATAKLLRAGIAARRGRRGDALAQYQEAGVALGRLRMAGMATAAKLRCGELLGGSEGATLEARAKKQLGKQGILTPSTFAQILAPHPG
jgi:hypothetical protein